jgi:hypothetical protein
MAGPEGEQPFQRLKTLIEGLGIKARPRVPAPLAQPDKIRDEVKIFQFGTPEGRSPFDIFLQYSNQKRKLAALEAKLLLESNGSQRKTLVDIGTSKGTLWMMLAGELQKQGYVNPIHAHLIEPDAASVRALRERVEGIRDYTHGQITSTVHHTNWEDFDPAVIGGPVDAVLCAHTIYYFPTGKYPQLFGKMIGMVRGAEPGHNPGKVIVAARTEDPIFHFIRNFFQDATGEPFNEKTINDASSVLLPSVAGSPGLTYDFHKSHAEVIFPWESDPEAAQKLVGFFLQRPWEEIPNPVIDRIQRSFFDGEPQDISIPQIDGVIEIGKL